MVDTRETLTASMTALSVTISDQTNAVSNKIGNVTNRSNWRLTGYGINVTNQTLEITFTYNENPTNWTGTWIHLVRYHQGNQDEIEFASAT